MSETELQREDRQSIAGYLILFLALVVFVRHNAALRSWWLTDDPQVLVQATRNSPADTLFDAAKWRTLSSSNFTPLVTLSFDADLSMFGVRAKPFYIHQLLSLSVAVILLFVYLRRFTSEALAFLAAAAFAVSPAGVMAARFLMIRHYVEGLALALAALLVWEWGFERRAPLRDSFAAVLYLIAMLAKEIYAPLPLLFIARSVIRREPYGVIVRRLVPSAVAAVVYLVWRSRILGSLGGYGSFASAELRWLPARIANALTAVSPDSRMVFVAIAMGLAILALVVFTAAKRPRASAVIGIALVVACFLPLLSLGESFEPRHVFGVAAALFAIAGVAAASLKRAVAVIVMTAVLASSFVLGLTNEKRISHDTAAMIAEGWYVWTASSTSAVLLATAPGWYLDGLSWLRRSQGRGAGPRFILSKHALAILDTGKWYVVESVWGSEKLRGGSREVAKEAYYEKRRLAPDIPLKLRFERRGADLHWEVAPSGGSFMLLTVPYYDDYPLPEKGWRRLPESGEKQMFRIRRALPDGRWNVSPELPLPRDGEVVVWDSATQKPFESDARRAL